MNIPHVLAQVIRQSPSLSKILDATVEIVARELSTDVCSIYLLDPADHRLRLAATRGLKQEALGKVVLALGEGLTGTVVAKMRSIAVDDAEKHPAYRYFPETGEEYFHSYLGVPLAIRNRPVGALVVQTRAQRVFTSDERETLATIAAQLVGVVENARLIEALDQPDRGSRYLKELRSWNREIAARSASVDTKGERRLRGNAASDGIAIGKALYRGSYDLGFEAIEETPSSPTEEKERLALALERTRSDILRLQDNAAREADEEHALIFSSHQLLANDVTLVSRLEAAIDSGLSAPRAVDQVFHDIGSQLGGTKDVYLQERVEDIRDLRNRVLANLIEGGMPSESISNQIVVAHGLPPSLVMELKIQGALAIVTERGGMTSHGALLARAMGIPAVTGVDGLVNQVRSGDEIIVDGKAGEVILEPSAETVAQYQTRSDKLQATRTRLKKLRDKPAESRDGIRVPLLANVGMASELHQATLFGAEGIGLYRTEFPFMIREDFPTREEQLRIYRRACRAFPDSKVHFRIIDLGGDKHHPRISRDDELNPALGLRSIRLILNHPRLLKEQVQAFLLASPGKPVGILIPMLSSLGELHRTRELIREAMDELGEEHLGVEPSLGAMIEVPAAVEIATDLAREVDFFSIGSNDLIQFTLAADRDNAHVAPYSDPYHPALLRMVRRTIQAAHDAGIPVGFCGELAAHRDLACLLVAMGIDSLSLTPNAIPPVKEAIRDAEIEPLRAKLDEILALSEAEAIRKAVAEALGDRE